MCKSHIGISVFPNDTKIAEDLLHNAVLAFVDKFQINEKGYHFFLPPMRTKPDRRLSVKFDLEKAIEAEVFTLYFQPKLLLETGRKPSLAGITQNMLKFRPLSLSPLPSVPGSFTFRRMDTTQGL